MGSLKIYKKSTGTIISEFIVDSEYEARKIVRRLKEDKIYDFTITAKLYEQATIKIMDHGKSDADKNIFEWLFGKW